MIHIATIHWESDRWVDPQLRFLERHTGAPYRVYAWLTGPEVARHADRFFSAETEGPELSPPRKLNLLAERISEGADDGDILIFLDGDAFPVGELAPAVEAMLAKHPLAAIRRDEIYTPFPHPSFCATTVGFWREIQGDWRIGPAWKRSTGRRIHPDVGARLLRTLDERGLEWRALLRTNVTDLHPLLFGVYENLIYHHGAGFRPPITRIDIYDAEVTSDGQGQALTTMESGPAVAENMRLDQYVFEQIQADDAFWRTLFMATSPDVGQSR